MKLNDIERKISGSGVTFHKVEKKVNNQFRGSHLTAYTIGRGFSYFIRHYPIGSRRTSGFEYDTSNIFDKILKTSQLLFVSTLRIFDQAISRYNGNKRPIEVGDCYISDGYTFKYGRTSCTFIYRILSVERFLSPDRWGGEPDLKWRVVFERLIIQDKDDFKEVELMTDDTTYQYLPNLFVGDPVFDSERFAQIKEMLNKFGGNVKEIVEKA